MPSQRSRIPRFIERAFPNQQLECQSALALWICQSVGNEPTPSADITVPPFINHTPTPPTELRQRMSEVPSPLKSPVWEIVQSLSKEPTPTADITVPWLFISHATTPPALWRQRMSVMPSRLKSPVPTIVQSVRGNEPRAVADLIVPSAFISQSPTPPPL